ncbi:DUF1801 domain-containing protein [Mucilaginibacter agri]|uniref:DUF1801 domain-containing protein n=1 Tax=Mucilaginibacter agri TaxID=2695265 RepID=A0A965ZGT4_9SPHI|nr:DUF1801 domain-containing protein [Mucilaginibacter agri]NCD69719.1 DUF1801 domain-containing protein [Mucilaginibacter agri]
MLRPIDDYFLQKDEPVRSCLQFLRKHILDYDAAITEAWRYGMPFYYYKGKMFCYLWVHKKFHLPYIGMVDGKLIDHPDLIQEKRARMKIMLIDPSEDLPIGDINNILNQAMKLRQ